MSDDNVFQFPLNWIPLARFCELTGYTPAAIRTKISRGELAESVQYRHAPDGSIQMSCKGWDQWVESSNRPRASRSAVSQLGSRSTTRASAAEKR